MALQLEDVNLFEDNVLIKLFRSKTDQRGKGIVVKLQTRFLKATCPMALLRAYMAIRGPSDGFLFQDSNADLLTHFQFWKVTSMALKKIGMQHCHSKLEQHPPLH
ncbi:hypothetical protein JRQ81_001781, partial [Phrynocephalus forsythii]